jgi:cysteine desulfurase
MQKKDALKLVYVKVIDMLFKAIKKVIYADHASATPISKTVLESMDPYLKDMFYNPSAIYSLAQKVTKSIEKARESIASVLHARPVEVYFVDGATEGNNIALMGVINAFKKKNPHIIPHVITCSVEHSSVLEPLINLSKTGNIELSTISVNENGSLNEREFIGAIKDSTILVSIGYANGELGIIQDIKKISKIIRHHKKHNKTHYPFFHTDAVQAINYIENLNVLQLGVDMLCFNASKIYGPKKIAALYIHTSVDIESIFFGGGQELGMRPGTENTPYVIGLEQAVIETRFLCDSESKRMKSLQIYAYDLFKEISGIVINTSKTEGLPNILNVSFPFISHEEVIIRLDSKKIYASVKSACKAGEEGDSHVILAIRGSNNKKLPTGSLRFSFGRSTTKKDISIVRDELEKIVGSMTETYKKYSL